MLDEHLDDSRIGGVAIAGEGGEQDFFLFAEMPGGLCRAEAEKVGGHRFRAGRAPTAFAQGVRFQQPSGMHQPMMVIHQQFA
jgi:hypothetical protein